MSVNRQRIHFPSKILHKIQKCITKTLHVTHPTETQKTGKKNSCLIENPIVLNLNYFHNFFFTTLQNNKHFCQQNEQSQQGNSYNVTLYYVDTSIVVCIAYNNKPLQQTINLKMLVGKKLVQVFLLKHTQWIGKVFSIFIFIFTLEKCMFLHKG